MPTTAETIVSTPVGSPQYQEQRALGLKPSSTISGGNSDDPVHLGDGLNDQELPERVTNLETFVEEIKFMMQIMIKNFKPKPTNAKIAKEMWKHVQPYLHLQKQATEERYTMQIESVLQKVDTRYQETQIEVKPSNTLSLRTMVKL
ncbi:hypothetical protein Hanom_Chr06g00549241 [Helianthus anomalus]